MVVGLRTDCFGAGDEVYAARSAPPAVPPPAAAVPDASPTTPATATTGPAATVTVSTSGQTTTFEPTAVRMAEPRPGRRPVQSERRPQTPDHMNTLWGAGFSVFHSIDRDGNGHLNRTELMAAMRNPGFRGAEAAAVVTMLCKLDELQALSNDEVGPENDGITLSDLLAADSTPGISAHQYFDLAMTRIRTTPVTLFPQGIDSIGSGAINQNGIGDCYFISALAGLADLRPSAIQNMVHENTDGTFTVTFPGHEPITVPPPTDGEIGYGLSGRAGGLWPTIIENAFAQLENAGGGGDAYDQIGGGGFLNHSIQLLTGHDSETITTLFHSAAGLGERMHDALNDNRVVTAAIRVTMPLVGARTSEAGLPTGHVYTVRAVNLARGRDGQIDPNASQIEFRNPWGTTGASQNGIHVMSLAEFRRNFDFVGLELPPATPSAP